MLGSTPMMLQYQKIKDNHKDSIVFYRLGDFYEMFADDALLASKLLNIALTSREAGKGNKIPMCGVPFHSAESYIGKLIEKGHKVAICEQVEDPKDTKGIVKREVVRIITPGTVLENSFLKDKFNNYLISLDYSNEIWGLAAVDISTGDFFATEMENSNILINEILRYNPAECIISQKLSESECFGKISKILEKINFTKHLDYAFKFDYAKKLLLEHFQVNSLYSLGCQDYMQAVKASGAIIDYLLITQKSKPSNLAKISLYTLNSSMLLDFATKRNLELTSSLQTNSKKDSLLGIIDYTVTALGGRMLKQWLEQPLLNKEIIKERLDATEEFFDNTNLRNKLQKLLEPVYDLERITARISFGSANCRDLIALKNSIGLLPEIKDVIANTNSNKLNELNSKFNTLKDLFQLLDESLILDPPISLREGNLIKENFNEEVDSLRSITLNGKQWIINLEQEEKKKTGIKSLKIGFNKVFGYYLEVTNSNLSLVPEDYIRKQTLANAERFITPALKEMEAKVIGAEEKLKNLEYKLFIALRNKVKEFTPEILDTAKILAEIDCLLSLAKVAVFKNYVKPHISEEGNLNILNCRHPVVEEKLEENCFIPNDIYLNSTEQRFLIITGPNMAGKSTYCRSLALASILMQIGSFVPAQQAELPVFDRVFARIGASDDLSTGQSTFMVEMNEVANIINNATENSLIILDEVGRGTSTYDGLSIAWALTEYINSKLKAKTLFATHYHELTKLENIFEGIKNFSVSVQEKGDHIVFLRKIIPGGADRSYGIQVAKLAGIPEALILRAKNILNSLENNNNESDKKYFKIEEDTSTIGNDYSNIINEILELDLINITPLKAMNYLFELQNKAKKEV